VTGLLDGLAILTRIRLPRVANGPDAMRIAVVSTGMDTVPILLTSIGWDRPQFPVRKSTGFRPRRLRRALAMPASDQTRASLSARRGAMQVEMRAMMPILSFDEGRQG
jgi:hypothetical protein